MPSIPSLELRPNGFYYVTWSEGRRSRRESTGTRQVSAAKAYLAQFLLNHAADVAPPEETFTIAELWSVYNDKHLSSVAAPDGPRYAWKNLEKHFGAKRPFEVDQDMVEEYEALRVSGGIGKAVVPSTVRKELGALRAALNWCADPTKKRKLLKADHVPAFELPASGEPRDRWLRHEEIQRLLAAAATMRTGKSLGRVERFLWLALETAGRKSALLELTWDRVDFDTLTIHLDVPGREKTKKRRADVPISPALEPVLRRAYDERTTDHVCDHEADIWASVQIAAERAGFGDPDRKPRKSGDKPKATGISPNVLRHTAATHMARRGVSLYIISKILGNTIAMVEKVYAKYALDDLRAGVGMISGGVLEAAE